MSASGHEQDWAKRSGVNIKHWAAPTEVLCEGGEVRGVKFACTQQANGKLEETGESFVLAADMVFKAIGQACEASAAGASIQLRNGRIVIDAEGRTSHAKVWAGGDCAYGGRDLTVEAVEHGKRAAISVNRTLEAKNG
jgi:glutamate synthase (NADPH/NADH) small chain